MVTVNFTQLRENAKTYFDQVEHGETIFVMRHGKIIAHISPPRKKQPAWKKKALRLIVPGVSLSKIILEERRKSL